MRPPPEDKMTYAEMKSEYENARKARNSWARNAWPFTEAEYAAASCRMDEMMALMQQSPEHVPATPLTYEKDK